MPEALFKEYLEFIDGKLVWWRGKTVFVEVGALGLSINELRLTLNGNYIGMGIAEAIKLRNMIDRGIEILKRNPYQPT